MLMAILVWCVGGAVVPCGGKHEKIKVGGQTKFAMGKHRNHAGSENAATSCLSLMREYKLIEKERAVCPDRGNNLWVLYGLHHAK
jgi:hypothetical protein